MYLAMLMSASNSSSTTTDAVLDKDSYYNATLIGPTSSSENRPKIKISYGIPKE